MNKLFIAVCAFGIALLFEGCAGERQGFVCEEIEYRLNSMTYSPDQRAYMEEELRTCREEETKKKNESGMGGGNIYERYANMEGVQQGDSSKNEIPVSTLLQDSSEEKTTSIYDRYKSSETGAPAGDAPSAGAEP